MTITRQSTIPSSFSMAELLSFLQVDGRLRDVAVPHWATDTSVEELLDALRLIGDGEWLVEMPEYSGHSPQDAADKWLRNFMEGRPVCHPDDSRHDSNAASTTAPVFAGMDEAESECSEASLAEYVATLSPTARTRFTKRLETPAFKSAALNQIMIMGKTLTLCALADERLFLAERDTLVQPGDAIDKDLRAMSLYYLAPENRAAMFQHFLEHGADLGRAEKRAKEIHGKLKKIAVDRLGR